MGRTARFTDEHFVAAAQRITAREGPAGLTVLKIAGEAGATTGSVYHRFESVETIAALAWVEAAEAFQAAFAATLTEERPFERIMAAALHTPQWSRVHLTQAQVLLRSDAAGLMENENLPQTVRRRVHALRRGLRRSMVHLGRGSAGSQDAMLLQFLVVDLPLAAVKPHLLRARRPPQRVDAMIQNSIRGFREEVR